MTETIKNTQHYYTKEFGSYNNSEDNFVANQELTVTITLNEYRKLIENNAKAKQKIEEANSDKYKRENEICELKKVITDLKERLYNSSFDKVNQSENLVQEGEN